MTGPAFLELRGITKRFAGIKAVGGDDGLDLRVERGTFLGLIGPNGAGKSTTFGLISGVHRPDRGDVLMDGRSMPVGRPAEIAALGVGQVFQTPRPFPSLSVLENVVVAADNPGETLIGALTGRWRAKDRALRERAAAKLESVGLSSRTGAAVANLSGGELRMLEIARALMREPDLLLLDEPTAGVDPTLQERLSGLLVQLGRDGVTLVVVEHNLNFLMKIADRVAVLVSGEILAEGNPGAVKTDQRVIEAYLGGDHAA